MELDVERLGQLPEHDIEDVLVFLVDLKQLFSSREHHSRKEIYRHDSIMCQEEVEQPRNVLVVLYVVREHGDCACQGEGWLTLGQMIEELRIGGAKDGSEQFELGYGGVERGQHEVTDTEQTETGYCRRCILHTEDEQEDLDDVVVALKVAQRRVAAEHIDYYIRKLFLPAFQLLL